MERYDHDGYAYAVPPVVNPWSDITKSTAEDRSRCLLWTASAIRDHGGGVGTGGSGGNAAGAGAAAGPGWTSRLDALRNRFRFASPLASSRTALRSDLAWKKAWDGALPPAPSRVFPDDGDDNGDECDEAAGARSGGGKKGRQTMTTAKGKKGRGKRGGSAAAGDAGGGNASGDDDDAEDGAAGPIEIVVSNTRILDRSGRVLAVPPPAGKKGGEWEYRNAAARGEATMTAAASADDDPLLRGAHYIQFDVAIRLGPYGPSAAAYDADYDDDDDDDDDYYDGVDIIDDDIIFKGEGNSSGDCALVGRVGTYVGGDMDDDDDDDDDDDGDNNEDGNGGGGDDDDDMDSDSGLDIANEGNGWTRFTAAARLPRTKYVGSASHSAAAVRRSDIADAARYLSLLRRGEWTRGRRRGRSAGRPHCSRRQRREQKQSKRQPEEKQHPKQLRQARAEKGHGRSGKLKRSQCLDPFHFMLDIVPSIDPCGYATTSRVCLEPLLDSIKAKHSYDTLINEIGRDYVGPYGTLDPTLLLSTLRMESIALEDTREVQLKALESYHVRFGLTVGLYNVALPFPIDLAEAFVAGLDDVVVDTHHLGEYNARGGAVEVVGTHAMESGGGGGIRGKVGRGKVKGGARSAVGDGVDDDDDDDDDDNDDDDVAASNARQLEAVMDLHRRAVEAIEWIDEARGGSGGGGGGGESSPVGGKGTVREKSGGNLWWG